MEPRHGGIIAVFDYADKRRAFDVAGVDAATEQDGICIVSKNVGPTAT
jgi:hypothetical protein